MAGRSRRRLWVTVALCFAVTVVFGVGWFAARQFQSPAQRAAQAEAPAPGPIFVAVTYGELSDQVSGAGKITSEFVSPLILTQVPANAVVTATPVNRGASVGPGSVITEINGRPVFVFAGAFNFYRDLGVGTEGPDVRQLQRGLRAAGDAVPSAEGGHYGTATEAAVRRLYQEAGYRPPTGLPLTELAATPVLPAALSSVPPIGSHPAAGMPIATLSRGRLVASIALDGGAFVRVRKGLAASIAVSGAPSPLAAVVTSTSEAAAGGQSTVTLTPSRPPSDALTGRRVVGTITVQVLAKASLLVPTRAIATDQVGMQRVLVERGTHKARPVQVTVLGSLAGRSAVRPRFPSDLLEGDKVQVG